MADIEVIKGTPSDGVSLGTQQADSGGDTFENDGNTLLYIENATSGSETVTIKTFKTVDGENVDDKQVSLSGNSENILGDFETDIYNNSNGKVELSYSNAADLFVSAVRPTIN